MNNTNPRMYTREVVDVFQVLYQNGIINNEEKNNLMLLFRESIADDTVAKNKLCKEFRDLFEAPQTTMFAKQQIERILYLLE